MRSKSWCLVVAALASNARASPGHHNNHLHRQRGSPTTTSPRYAVEAPAFLHPGGSLSWFSSPAPATRSPNRRSFAARAQPYCRHRRHRSKTWLPPPLPPRAGATRGRQRYSALAMISDTTLPSDDPSNSSNKNKDSRLLQAGGVAGSGGGGGIALWLDMRTAILPAAQTLKVLYDDLRQREEALGRSPGDSDWSLGRVPNPVGALFYAAEPPERAAEEMKALGGGGALPCFRLSSIDEGKVLDASSGGGVVGVALDPAGGAGGGNPAVEVVAAAQQADSGGLVLLRGVRPSVWEGGDMGTVLQIAASACAGAGKTLVVTARSVGQLHDAAMAAFAASQTQVLEGRNGDEGAGEEDSRPVVLLIEAMPELWEAGLLYL